jgi:hypothetical protein
MSKKVKLLNIRSKTNHFLRRNQRQPYQTPGSIFTPRILVHTHLIYKTNVFGKSCLFLHVFIEVSDGVQVHCILLSPMRVIATNHFWRRNKKQIPYRTPGSIFTPQKLIHTCLESPVCLFHIFIKVSDGNNIVFCFHDRGHCYRCLAKTDLAAQPPINMSNTGRGWGGCCLKCRVMMMHTRCVVVILICL